MCRIQRWENRCAAETIQLFWRQRRCVGLVIKGMQEGQARHRDGVVLARSWEVDPMDPETAVEIEYCVKHANFRHHREMLKDYLAGIEQGLWEDQWEPSICRRGGEFYYHTEVARDMLQKRLGM